MFTTEGAAASVASHCEENGIEYTTSKAKEVAKGLRITQSKYSRLMVMRNTPAAYNKDTFQMYIQLQRSLFTAIKPIIIHTMTCDRRGTYSEMLKLDVMKAY